MQITTSFAPSRVARQKECIASWQRYGNRVTAVQTSLESIDPIAGVDFRISRPSQSSFNRSYLPRITDLIAHGDTLVVNSDIELVGPLDYEFRPDTLYCGIRHNGPELERWGIDAIYVPRDIAQRLPDVGLLVGMPGWDWWLPYHCHTAGIQIEVDKRPIYQHTPHPVRWSAEDHAISKRIIQNQCDISHEALASIIQRITGRQ